MVVFKLQLLGEICTQTSIGNYIFCTSNNHSICLSYSQLCELSFHITRHLRNPYNENLPVKELEPSIGEQLTSLLYLEPDNMSSTGNHEGEQSSPNSKKSKKLQQKEGDPRYVIKLPLQIGKSTHTPIVEPRQSQPKNVQPTPLEPENVYTNPKIPSPHLNASPTPSPTQIPSTRASQYCVGRVSPLSSPSEPNHSPLSIPSTRQENVVMQEQTSSEVTQPSIPADPPPGAVLPEEFEKIFSQTKYEVASCGGGSECSPLDPSVEEKIRNQSWFTATGGRNKGRVYGVGKVQAGYRCGDNFTQPTTSSASSEKITMLEEKVRKTQEENEKLSRKFETLLNVVLPFLLAEAAQPIFQQSQENQQQHQQPPQPSNQAVENQENNLYETLCIFCNQHIETATHLFLECQFSSIIWLKWFHLFNTSGPAPWDLQQHYLAAPSAIYSIIGRQTWSTSRKVTHPYTSLNQLWSSYMIHYRNNFVLTNNMQHEQQQFEFKPAANKAIDGHAISMVFPSQFNQHFHQQPHGCKSGVEARTSNSHIGVG
ncbi:hypothetical protein Fmac_019268 [Flemingia macrophylla]|uniref:Reverse transcriptase zinc-binding domain-containing protein n=1 Tax=Flemingia macrophylla TaxID=520843 RepID=A0ABD1M7F3_9FABA